MSDGEDPILAGRRFLRGAGQTAWQGIVSDQSRGLAEPAPQKAVSGDARLITLPAPETLGLGTMSLAEALRQRRSRRRFAEMPVTLQQLAWLCWAAQGVSGPLPVLRTAPSGGARHPFETYLVVQRVTGLEPGIYRYLPLDHSVVCEQTAAVDAREFAGICNRQNWTRKAALHVVWSCLPYRAEWRYDRVAHKTIAIDLGHAAQNLYLACESAGLGCCTIAAYDPVGLDAVLGLDGVEEFSVYLASVGVML